MKKRHLLYFTLLLLTACSVSHEQQYSLRNNSSYTFEYWRYETDSTYVLEQTIPPGAFDIETQYVKGYAKDYVGMPPSFMYTQFDSIAISGNHTLIKDLQDGNNWNHTLIGSGNNKDLHMEFEFDDSDVQ